MKKKKEKEVKLSPLIKNYIPEEMIWAKTLSHRNEYSCGTISDNIKDMMKNVHDGIMDTLKLNGYNSVEDLENERYFRFFGLYISIMLDIFISTGIPYIFREMLKPKVEFKLDRNSNVYVNLTDENRLTSNVEKREKLGTLKDKFCPDKDNKNYKASLINDLRKYLFTNNFTLKVKKLPNGCYTFYDKNKTLNILFPELVNLKGDFFSGTNWIENLDIEELENRIKKLLQVDVSILNY